MTRCPPQVGSNSHRARRRRRGAAPATSARRRPGRGAPARAGRRAARRPSRADGSPSVPRDRPDRLATRRVPIRAPPSGRCSRPPTRSRATPEDARAPTRTPRRPVPARRPVRPAPLARRQPRRVHGEGRAVGRDGYRQAVWLAPVDGSEPARRLTLGVRSDGAARFSPDGTTLAFISDRRLYVEEEPDRPTDAKEREDCYQVPPAAPRRRRGTPAHGPAARRERVRLVARRPDARDPDELARRDDARRTAGSAAGPPKPKPGEPPLSDYRLHRPAGLPVQRRRLHRRQGQPPVARRRRDGRGTAARRGPDARGASPPGRPTAPGSRSRRTGAATPDLDGALGRSSWSTSPPRRRHDRRRRRRRDLLRTRPGRSTARRSSPWATGSRAAATGPASGGSRPTAPTRAPRGGTDLLAPSELKPDAAMNSDVTLGRGAACSPSARRRARPVPRRRSRAATSCGGWRSTGRRPGAPDDRTEHYLSRLGRRARAAPRPIASPPSARAARELPGGGHVRRPRRRVGRRRSGPLTALNAELAAELDARRAAGAPLAERRPRDPGLAAAGRDRPPAARRSRSTAGRTPCTAGRRCSSGRSSPAPASRCSPRTRAARRATARRSTSPTSATGATARWRTSSPASTRRSRTASPTRTGWASRAARTAAT